jgi:hypothetical protein
MATDDCKSGLASGNAGVYTHGTQTAAAIRFPILSGYRRFGFPPIPIERFRPAPQDT